MIDVGPSSGLVRRKKTRNILSKLFGVGGGFGLINWSAQVDDEPKGKKEKEAKVGCVESFFVRTLGIVSVLFLAKGSVGDFGEKKDGNFSKFHAAATRHHLEPGVT